MKIFLGYGMRQTLNRASWACGLTRRSTRTPAGGRRLASSLGPAPSLLRPVYSCLVLHPRPTRRVSPHESSSAQSSPLSAASLAMASSAPARVQPCRSSSFRVQRGSSAVPQYADYLRRRGRMECCGVGGSRSSIVMCKKSLGPMITHRALTRRSTRTPTGGHSARRRSPVSWFVRPLQDAFRALPRRVALGMLER